MSDQYIGEIRLFAGTFAPVGWFLCQGQVLQIVQFQPLFAIIGTYYGGNGAQTFQLPDLRGRMPIHAGQAPSGTSYVVGEAAGSEQVALNPLQIPAHTHQLRAGGAATSSAPAGNVPAVWSGVPYAAAGTPTVTLGAAAVDSAGQSQSHDNMPPFLALNYIIAWDGIYPSRD